MLSHRKRIAVIGAGISGLGAAYLLSQKYDVTLYEKNEVLGGHARTKIVDCASQKIPVDTGFIVYNELNYPHLTGLFKHLDVAVEKSDMSFGFSLDQGAFEWGARNMNALFGQRSNLLNPQFYKMFFDALRFFKKAPSVLSEAADLTLGEFLDCLKLGTVFRERFILPMGAAIWSCSSQEMLDFPAKTFVQFFKNHGLLTISDQPQWYTVRGGSVQYIEKIKQAFRGRIKLSSPVDRVFKQEDIIVETCQGEQDHYDHVILAAHADEALSMLSDATIDEREILSQFAYHDNHAYLHSDGRIMPKRRACWSSWNYSGNSQGGKLSLTYWMNLLQNIDEQHPLFVTLNPQQSIAREKVFDEHVFRHPVFNRAAIAAQAKVPSIQGVRGVWFCGAYQRYGFHEDGLLSAVKVAEQLGVSVPWR